MGSLSKTFRPDHDKGPRPVPARRGSISSVSSGALDRVCTHTGSTKPVSLSGRSTSAAEKKVAPR